MEVSLPVTLLNSISHFGSLSSSNSANAELIQRYFLKIGDILEPLKRIFEEFNFPELGWKKLSQLDWDRKLRCTMEVSLPVTLLNSISHFGSLSSSNSANAELIQRYFLKIGDILEPLKRIFEEFNFPELGWNEKLYNVLKDLDAVINEARELIESWHHLMSKVYFVMQIESELAKLQTFAVKTCQLLNSSLADNCSSTCVENCMQKIQLIDHEQTSNAIKEAIRAQVDKSIPRSVHLETISRSLSLSSNQELLMEAVALDKLKAKVARSESHAEIEGVSQMMALINYMHDCYVKIKQLDSINGVPIPADFCCPLSLELMSDPVIVASGQTYERAFIKQWLDQGFNVCPKTYQTLGHTNLIPNYTVKALIANWSESNDIKLPDPLKSINLNLPSVFLSLPDSSANGSAISHSSQSPRENHLRSPDLLIKDSTSSNGFHQNKKPTSRPISLGSPMHIANGCETDIASMSLVDSDVKKESSLEERQVCSSSQTSNQSKQDLCRAPVVDEQFQGHNRSVSACSNASNNGHLQGEGDGNMVSSASSDRTHYSSDTSGEVAQDSPFISAPLREPALSPRLAEVRSRSQSSWQRPSERFVPRIISSPSMESRLDLSGVETQTRKIIEDLKSESVDVQRAATAELRLLAKHNMENRIVIANCGAIILLVGLLHSTDPKTQENAVTALLNLSINGNNKTAIANADAIDPLIHVLETGNPEAKENAAATLFSLSVVEENKVSIGRSRAIKPLVELLGNGTPRGKKDAATALFNLSILNENKARIVNAGAVRHLVELMDPAAGMIDKAVAVLANLATIPEGRTAIGHAGGIPVLVEVVELGSARGKENAAAALLQLCINSNRLCNQVLQEGAVPPLVALSQSGTARAKEKAQALLSHFRNQRHGGGGRA